MKYVIKFDVGQEEFDRLSDLMLKYPNAVETARVGSTYYFE